MDAEFHATSRVYPRRARFSSRCFESLLTTRGITTSIARGYATLLRRRCPSWVRATTPRSTIGTNSARRSLLTDVTFCREGNPSHRASPRNPEKKLLNFNKYHKLARIVQDLQRFQVPLNLKDVPEAQEYIHFCLEKAKDHGDLDDLYRRR